MGILNSYADLLKRFAFLFVALIVYRLGCFITLPAVDIAYVDRILDAGLGSGIINMFNLFSGGALGRMTVFSLNVMPYIVSSIVVQIIIGSLRSEGKIDSYLEQRKVSFYSKLLCVFLSICQSYVLVIGLQRLGAFGKDFALLDILICIVTLVASSMFLIWLGSQITARGVGNGISMIIFAGIVAELPSSISGLFNSSSGVGGLSGALLLLGLTVLLFLIVLFEKSSRNLHVAYPSRIHRLEDSSMSSSYIPIKINVSGVIPPIFANALIIFPITIAELKKDWFVSSIIVNNFSFGQPFYFVLYFCMIVFFCFFYSDFVFNAKELSQSLKKSGAIVASKRPGESTRKYLDYVLKRITAFGSLYISFVCIVPDLIKSYLGLSIAIGGTSLLIIVGVSIDFFFAIQAYLFNTRYRSISKGKYFAMR